MEQKSHHPAKGGGSDVPLAGGPAEPTESIDKSQRGKPTRQAAWRARNPLAYWAHSALRSAEKRGLIRRPASCESCGSTERLDGHHDDYLRPLSVAFICRRCHAARHRRERAK